MGNKYVFREDYALVLIKSKNGLFEAKIDREDVEKCKLHTWSIEGYPNNIYVSHRGRKITNLKLHRYLKDTPDNLIVDHINRDRLDNRKVNLRNCTIQENNMNKSIISKKTASGIRNVHWDKARNKWKVMVRKDSKTINIGRYDNLEEAKKAADDARLKYHRFDSSENMPIIDNKQGDINESIKKDS